MTTTITLFKTVEGITPIKLGRRRLLVSGLYWQVLPSTQNHMQEARAIAKKERDRTGKILDVVFLRRHTDVVQAGMVLRGGRSRIKKGTFALAAVAADVLGPTFIAAFPLPDGRYAVTSAVHNAIVPDSDGVYEEAEAKHLMRELWNSLSGSLAENELQVYAPSALWAGAKPIELADLLGGIKRSHRLRQRPQFATDRKSWIVWMLAVLTAAGGWWVWDAQQKRLAYEIELQKTRELERLRAASGAKANDESLARPWTYMPSVPAFVKICTEQIGRVPLTLDGWILVTAQCTTQDISATFARTDGRTVHGFISRARDWDSKALAQFSADGDMGTLSWKTSMPLTGDEGLDPLPERLNNWMSWWQRRFIPFDVTPVQSRFAPGYQPPQNTASPESTTPHWRTVRWTINSTDRNPRDLFDAPFKHNGVRLKEIKLSFGGDGKLNWSLQGELYGK